MFEVQPHMLDKTSVRRPRSLPSPTLCISERGGGGPGGRALGRRGHAHPRFRSRSLANGALGSCPSPVPAPDAPIQGGGSARAGPVGAGSPGWELLRALRPPREEDERDAELVYPGGRAPGGPDRGTDAAAPPPRLGILGSRSPRPPRPVR